MTGEFVKSRVWNSDGPMAKNGVAKNSCRQVNSSAEMHPSLALFFATQR